MDRREIGSIILNLVLGVSIVITRLYSLPIEATAVLAASFAVSNPIYDSLLNLLDKRKEIQDKRNRIRKSLNNFEENLKELEVDENDTNKEEIIDNAIKSEIETEKINLYKFFAIQKFGERDEIEFQIILILIFCENLSNLSNSVGKAEIIDEIDRLAGQFNFKNLGEDEKKLLEAYLNREENRKLLERREIEDYREKAIDFLSKYTHNDTLGIAILQDKEKAEEFRRTLAELVDEGKLETLNIEKQIQEAREELEGIGEEYTAYLVLSRKLFTKSNSNLREKLENHFARILSFGRKKASSEFPEFFLSMHLIYPKNNYQKPETFLEEEIRPLIPEDRPEDSFVVAMPIEIDDFEDYPSEEEIREICEGENLNQIRQNYQALKFLRTGSQEDAFSIVSENLTKEIDISELMSVIPFNVLVPKINGEEKDVIKKKYSKLKKEFEIEDLYDWNSVNKEDLAKSLEELDEENVAQPKRWEEISESIISGAKEISAARRG